MARLEENQIVIYTSPKGEVFIEARVKDESVWLSLDQMAELFWANQILRSYLLKGYAINEKLLREQNKRLEEIKSTILMISEKSNVEGLIGKEKELLQIIIQYAKSWKVLDEFDANSLETAKLNRQIQYSSGLI